MFVAHEGDHFRTRLTHSLEVAQIARSIAKALGLDADLAETVALGHDLGHPPFGHAGEEELERRMAPFGGFDHNVQTFRVVTELERRYPSFKGLNLTWETLEGMVKHNGPVSALLDRPAWRADRRITTAIDLRLGHLGLGRGPGRGPVRRHRLQQPRRGRRAAGRTVPAGGAGGRAPDRPDPARRSRPTSGAGPPAAAAGGGAAHDRRHGRGRDGRDPPPRRDARVDSPEAVRALGAPWSAFSPDMAEDLSRLRAFLHERMYRHYRVNRTRSQARRILAEMFELFLAEPDVLPAEWLAAGQGRDDRPAGPGGVRLHRRHDRPVRHRGTPQAFQLDVWGPTMPGAVLSGRPVEYTLRDASFDPGGGSGNLTGDAMSDQIAAYTRPERPLSFDDYPAPRARRTRADDLDRQRHRAACLVGGVFYLYRGGLRERADRQTVGAPLGGGRRAAPGPGARPRRRPDDLQGQSQRAAKRARLRSAARAAPAGRRPGASRRRRSARPPPPAAATPKPSPAAKPAPNDPPAADAPPPADKKAPPSR